LSSKLTNIRAEWFQAKSEPIKKERLALVKNLKEKKAPTPDKTMKFQHVTIDIF